MLQAFRCSAEESLRRLLEQASLDEVVKSGESHALLEAAIEANRPEGLITPLLDAIARGGSEKRHQHATILHQCVSMGRFSWAKLLLDRGWEAAAPDELGATPLHHLPSGVACYLSLHEEEDSVERVRAAAEEVAQHFVHNGASPDATDVFGRTPLHSAASHACIVSVRALLAQHANPRVRDGVGRTPADVASGVHDSPPELLDLLGEATPAAKLPLPPLPPGVPDLGLRHLDVGAAGEAYDDAVGVTPASSAANSVLGEPTPRSSTQQAAARRAASLALDPTNHALVLARLLHEKADAFAADYSGEERQEAWDAVFDALAAGAGEHGRGEDGQRTDQDRIRPLSLVAGLQAMNLPASEDMITALLVILSSAAEEAGVGLDGDGPPEPGVTRSQFRMFCASPAPEVPASLMQRLSRVQATEVSFMEAHSGIPLGEGESKTHAEEDATMDGPRRGVWWSDEVHDGPSRPQEEREEEEEESAAPPAPIDAHTDQGEGEEGGGGGGDGGGGGGVKHAPRLNGEAVPGAADTSLTELQRSGEIVEDAATPAGLPFAGGFGSSDHTSSGNEPVQEQVKEEEDGEEGGRDGGAVGEEDAGDGKEDDEPGQEASGEGREEEEGESAEPPAAEEDG